MSRAGHLSALSCPADIHIVSWLAKTDNPSADRPMPLPQAKLRS